MTAGDTETILEPAPSPDQKNGVQNTAFVPDDTSVDTGKGTPQTMKGPRKLWKWRLEGMTLVVLSVVVLSAAITVALIICIFAGPSQVQPHGAVASESGYCSRFGLELMEQDDGNAVDSAVATALCLAVVRPDVASLAGCGMMLVKNRNTQHSHLYDFMCSAPSNPPAADLNRPETLVGLPGFLKGLQLAHSQFGKRPWADLVRGASYAAANGFQPDTALLEAAKAVKSSNPSGAGTIVDSLVTLSGGIYTPPSALKDVLRTLAERGSETFYSGGTDSTSFANRLLSFMVGWQAKDLNDYKVNQPKPIQMGFAGFTLEAFPAPSSGGPFLLSLLGNTDLKNAVAPLSRKALAENDVNATATVLHRLIEFSKAAEASVLTLGDISDSSIADEATRLQNQLFSPTSRKALVNSVDDSGTLPVSGSLQRESDVAIGDTGIVATDSAYLTVVMNLFLGAPFGSGLVVPNTGVHLNAALRLFSNATLVNSSKPILNMIASGRRPLVPVSPVYLSTTQRKCGIRVGVTSSGGIWGSLDSAQVD
ncbi:gamma-glutamyltranspeptidase / glutathione hydrolase [Paragonimus westermani]|uniref:Gamma-glutamyltranspeptidase / glutathione hydrolase n=1 Tax=Paragonimus westermani TaxID=34504 RepID=A0A5J4N933_9TREM|nr:gamma-glutamyltranspeptidase / glutathione hydrolase [Paragonimus westermani]